MLEPRTLVLLLVVAAGPGFAKDRVAAGDTAYIEVRIGALASHQVVEVTARTRLKILQDGAPRPILVRTFFGSIESSDKPGRLREHNILAAETVVVAIPEGPVMYALFTDENTQGLVPIVLGQLPTQAGPLTERELRTRSPTFSRFTASTPTELTVDQLSELWLSIDAAWFVFSQSTSCGGQVGAGEPLLVISTEAAHHQRGRRGPPPTVLAATLLRANGERVLCDGPHHLKALSPLRPGALALPKPFTYYGEPTEFWADEAFLANSGKDAAVAKYVKSKESARVCAEAQWKKLDPDGRAGSYDVIARDSEGRVTSVESLWNRIDRKVSKKCNLERVRRARAKLAAKYYQKDLEANAQHLSRVRARLSDLRP